LKSKLLLLSITAILVAPFLAGCSEKNPMDEQLDTLREQGRVIERYDSAKEASKVAGFKVIEPSYIPDGFGKPKYQVFESGAGLPEDLKPGFDNTLVFSSYTYQPDRRIVIQLEQTVHKFSLGGSEPTELCGHPAERVFFSADPQKNMPYDRLAFGWEDGEYYFSLVAALGGTLTEDELRKMACSINPE
jgi:hypothetical protein